ncbi:invasion associated locus B family protein [Jannaschia ovalis]|uniref:Invasion associated locus B family protein n=1 Tax=Jannaschia ovalis TaxID=3038773 RepID=A0ABY8LJI3_9RHOB|nr:invasion associated locus B family protein [Jannaschia sp. GRR-S6-38]WGH80369.1 invasion associated locus B family protein [Jannaschia sp. GRR-S6-38]
MISKAIGFVLLAALATVPASAQESSNRVNTETDWSVFVEDNPTQCWIVSAPKSIRNTRDGREVAARRGDIRLFVSFWPGSDKNGEVSATGGYPYADGSTVTIEIGSDRFEMFTDGELAWAASPAEDERIIAAMKRGAQAVVSGRSGRGTSTQDTFSLLGFTAAVEDAETRCGA